MTHCRRRAPRVLLAVVFCALAQMPARAQDILPRQETEAAAAARPVALPCSFCGRVDGILPEPAWMRASGDTRRQFQAAPSSVATSRAVSWRLLPSNFLHDQKDLWLFPVQLAHGRHWLPTGTVIGLTAGLLAADPHDAPYFRRTSTFSTFNSGFNGTATAVSIALVPSAMYGIGLLRHDPYAQQTALLSGEAVADSAVLAIVMKDVSRRLRPSDIAPYGNFSDTFFHSKPTAFGAGSSFPSGHTILAFSVATVVARRYGKRHVWVRWVAYGAAATVGFSRITLQAHFPSDVFLGAALGYSIARFDVLRNQ